MENKICFLVPLHPKHFLNAKCLISSFFANDFERQSDLAFVFSNESEEEEFQSLCGSGYYKSVVMPTELLENQGIVNVKKLYALYCLKEFYEFIIIYDAEMIFIKNINLLQMCRDFLNQKILWGNYTHYGFSHIHNESARFFSSCENFKKLEKVPYVWFNQPHIYPCKFIDHFFEVTKITKHSYKSLSWGSFDYMIFAYYLVLFRDFKIEDIEVISAWGFLEHSDFTALSSKFAKLQFYHCNLNLYPFLDKDKIFALIHLDRLGQGECKAKYEAKFIIKNYLSYKLGRVFIENYSLKKIFKLPFILCSVVLKHKKELKKFQNFVLKNPKFKQEPLENYVFTQNDLQAKNHLAYKLGSAFFEASNNFWGGGCLNSPLKLIG